MPEQARCPQKNRIALDIPRETYFKALRRITERVNLDETRKLVKDLRFTTEERTRSIDAVFR